MCEYDPECSKADDPLVSSLWTQSGRTRAVWLVLCSKQYHPIAAVFDLPERGRVLCCPAYETLRRSTLIDTRGPLANSNGKAHLHASLRPLEDYAPDETERGRCRCGTWSYIPARMNPAAWGRPHRAKSDGGPGKPYVLANYVAVADAEAARRDRESGNEPRPPVT